MEFNRCVNPLKGTWKIIIFLFLPSLGIYFLFDAIVGITYIGMSLFFLFIWWNLKLASYNEAVYKIILKDDCAEIFYNKTKKVILEYTSMGMEIGRISIMIVHLKKIQTYQYIINKKDWDRHEEILSILKGKNVKIIQIPNYDFGI